MRSLRASLFYNTRVFPASALHMFFSAIKMKYNQIMKGIKDLYPNKNKNNLICDFAIAYIYQILLMTTE